MVDLDALVLLAHPPLHLQHAVRDMDSLRTNCGLLIFINVLADLAAPLCAGDALSACIVS